MIKMYKQKGSGRGFITAILVIVLLILVGFSVFFIVKMYIPYKAAGKTVPTPAPTLSATPVPVSTPKPTPVPTPVPTPEPTPEPTPLVEDTLDDSSFYQKLPSGADVNILILGDSCAEGTGALSATDSPDGKDHSWYAQLEDYIRENYLTDEDDSVNLTYLAAPDATVLNDVFRIRDFDDGLDYDLILLCYGHNNNTRFVFTYFEALLLSLHDRYPDSSIIDVLLPYYHSRTIQQTIIKNESIHYNIPVIDLFDGFHENGCGKYYNYISDDQFHPNTAGHDKWFSMLCDTIDSNVENSTGKMNIDADTLDPQAKMLARMEFVSIDDPRVTRVDDATFNFNVQCNGAGYLAHNEILGYQDIKVVADNIYYNIGIPDGVPMPSGHNLTLIYPEISCQNLMTISFSSKEHADGLKGIYVYNE